MLTAARSGEVRGMTWAEIDLNDQVWRVPSDRTKTRQEHRVPLCQRAIDVLREAQAYGDGEGLVFPSLTGRTLTDNALSKLLRELGIKGVVHGFRSSFRDWAGDSVSRANWPRWRWRTRQGRRRRIRAIRPVRAAAKAHGRVGRLSFSTGGPRVTRLFLVDCSQLQLLVSLRLSRCILVYTSGRRC